MKTRAIVWLLTLTAISGYSASHATVKKPDSMTIEATDIDSVWYNRGVDIFKGWLSNGFPTIYCDTAYQTRDYKIVVRAILARDRRVRVKTSVSGDTAAQIPTRPVVRFTKP